MIGTTSSGNDIGIDAKKLIGTHLAVVGNTGSGKTHTIRKVLEQLWGEGVHIVLDPEREFHTLRQAHPYLIVGGPFADMPHGDPTALARFLIENRHSAIIQFADDQHLEAQRDFIGAFLDGLMALPREFWTPAFIVIDEAHRYAPQGEGASSLRAVGTLMSQGRKRGFTGILATQRLAKISKSAIGECNTWLVGRVGQVLDRNAAANNLGFPLKSAEALGLRTLNPGQFWGFGVAFGPVPELITVGATQTQHLTLGQSWSPTPLTGISLPSQRSAAVGSLSPGAMIALGFGIAAGLARFVFF